MVSIANSNELAQHDTVLVTAGRFKADSIDNNYQTGRVSVISSEQFESDVATVADVLRKEVGVQIRQSGGLGSYSSTSIRGSTSAQVNVYLDGVLLNEAQGGSVDLGQFLLTSIDRIEIYRGNVPIQLGYAGIGGAINIVTKQGKSNDNNQVILGYGSDETKKSALSYSYNDEDANYLGTYEYLTSNNNFSLLNDNQTPNNLFDDRLERRNNAELSQHSALISTNHRLNDEFSINATVSHFDKLNGIPEVTNSAFNESELSNKNTYFQLKLNQFLTETITLAYGINASLSESLYDDRESFIGLNANLEETTNKNLGIKVDASIVNGLHTFNLSLLGRTESYLNKDLLRSVSQKLNRDELSFGLQDEWISENGSILINGRSRIRILSDEKYSPNTKSNTNQFLEHHAGLRYQINPLLVVQTNISSDVRVPSLYELYGDKGGAIGNPDLKEEKALNTDVGFTLTDNDLSITASLFHRMLDDAIITLYDSRGIGKSENISKARVSGIELEATKTFSSKVESGLKSTFQTTEDLSDIPSSKGNALPGHYEKEFVLYQRFSFQPVGLLFEYVHRSGGYYDSASVAALDISNQYHLMLDYKNQKHRLELSLKNLGGEQIEDFNRYPSPGRQAFLTYAYIF